MPLCRSCKILGFSGYVPRQQHVVARVGGRCLSQILHRIDAREFGCLRAAMGPRPPAHAACACGLRSTSLHTSGARSQATCQASRRAAPNSPLALAPPVPIPQCALSAQASNAFSVPLEEKIWRLGARRLADWSCPRREHIPRARSGGNRARGNAPSGFVQMLTRMSGTPRDA